jgi:hypothetical protein
LTGGTLPAGLTLTSSGRLQGTPTSTGTANFTVRCTDAKGSSVTQALTLDVAAAPVEAPHNYFAALTARPDCVYQNSLRTPALIAGVRNNPTRPTMLDYVYPSDPDPRKQDAMKLTVPEGGAGPGQQLRIPIPPSREAHVLITLDFWIGAEFDYRHAGIQDWKGAPLHIEVAGFGPWVGGRFNFVYARQHLTTQPPGGPFTMFFYPHVVGKAPVPKPPSWWCCRMPGYPLTYLPTNVPTTQAREYPEAIAPVDESVYPGGREFGVVAERWTRTWHYLERVPSEDWVSDAPNFIGTAMRAYKWTQWMADTARVPIRFMAGAVVGFPAATGANGLTELQVQVSPGNSADGSLYVGRGPLVGYVRNVAVLHGIDAAAVPALLQQPVAA